MKNNKTDATNVLKFFREAKEARQGGQNNLDMMKYGGDPPASKVKTIGKVTPGKSTNSANKPVGSHKTPIGKAVVKPKEKYSYNGSSVYKNY